MDRLWSPWRSEYISSGAAGAQPEICVFCEIQQHAEKDEASFVVHRAEHAFVVLNRFPYTSGHLLIVPHEHLADLDLAPRAVTDEMMELTKRSQTALREVYSPEGFNVGMNLGKAAGAGIAGHIHIHILPRWIGDTNFMTATGNARVLPEALEATYQKLRNKF